MLRKLILGLVALVALLLGVVFLGSELRLRHRYPVAVGAVPIPSDSSGLARGEHLYRSIGCAECHADDGGGVLYMDAGPIGLAAGPNLTRGPGGVGGERSDGDLVRAIRHGVRPDGTSLIMMPSEEYVHLTDDDLGAIVGYLRTLPPVEREVPRTHLRLLGRALHVAGKMNLLSASKTPPFEDPAPITPGATAEYGRYLADIATCHACHGPGLSGGPMGAPGAPPAANLTPAGIGGYTEADFVNTIRTGRRPAGTTLHQIMPWKQFRNMTDEELAALWQYLRSVPAKPFGGR